MWVFVARPILESRIEQSGGRRVTVFKGLVLGLTLVPGLAGRSPPNMSRGDGMT
jgi:hypothetical protein